MTRVAFYALVFSLSLVGSNERNSLFCLAPVQAHESDYLVGCGSADITGPAAGFPMDGFARKEQISAGIHLRQRARAFIIVEPQTEKRIVLVCAELCKIHTEIHGEVIARLKERYDDMYTLENVILSATHTHGGAGGYWRYAADGPIGTGFFPEYVAAIADGIESAIVTAHQQLQPGRILITRGEVVGASAQRSRIAYLNNPKSERALYPRDIDTEMTLLKFIGGESGTEELGTLNWFAVHPTSMTYNNHFLSGDSKGYASMKFESQKFESQLDANRQGLNGFVAAFAQSNCGDVTGNLNLNNTGPGNDEFESTQIIGQRQLDVARELYENASEVLAGPIEIRRTYVDFSNLAVNHEFTQSGPQSTSVAAYGYSFAAGSTEDGGGHPLFQEGMKDRNPAIDLLSYQIFPEYQPNDQIRQLHFPKAILFAPGVAKSNLGLAHVLPISICRIGQLALIVGPAEFTTMSGRRIRRSVEEVLGKSVEHLIIAGYSNAYGGYVSTREEYEMQQYEGGHTLFGPWTLAGYQQEYVRLAQAMVDGTSAEPGAVPASDPIPVKLRTIRLGPDVPPKDAEFGDLVVSPAADYSPGHRVEVAFWTGHPRNSYYTGGNYLSVERRQDDKWTTAFTDADWETRCQWQPSHKPQLPCRINITWDIPADAELGEYRIVHHGRYQLEGDAEPRLFEKATASFRVK